MVKRSSASHLMIKEWHSPLLSISLSPLSSSLLSSPSLSTSLHSHPHYSQDRDQPAPSRFAKHSAELRSHQSSPFFPPAIAENRQTGEKTCEGSIGRCRWDRDEPFVLTAILYFVRKWNSKIRTFFGLFVRAGRFLEQCLQMHPEWSLR